MALLSKFYQVAFRGIGVYLSHLYTNPVKTKLITNCFLHLFGNYIIQRITEGKLDNYEMYKDIIHFDLYGGLLHILFFKKASEFLMNTSKNHNLQLFLIEILFFSPLYLMLLHYLSSKQEQKSLKYPFEGQFALLPSILEDNFKYLSLLKYINNCFVPLILRDVISNIITVYWILYLRYKKQHKKSKQL